LLLTPFNMALCTCYIFFTIYHYTIFSAEFQGFKRITVKYNNSNIMILSNLDNISRNVWEHFEY